MRAPGLCTCVIAIAIAGVFTRAVYTAQVNVLTYHNDNARTGANLNETVLTPANVNVNTFGKAFVYNVDGQIYAQPLYVSGMNIPGKGIKNVVFVATQHNSVYAFDADSNAGAGGGLLWQVNLGPSAATPTSDFGNRYGGGFDAILPEVGITGTPVIDLTSGLLYVDTFTHEGTAYFHKLHALNITNGVEQSFSPVTVAASVAGSGVGSTNGVLSFVAKQHIQRGALTLAGGRLFVAFGGYDDTDPFHGWIIGYNGQNLQYLPSYVFITTPNSTVAAYGANAGEGGIWMGGGGLASDAAANLFFSIGNGSFNAFNNSGGTEYGDSILKLSTANGLSVLDYFTPYNQDFLAANDLDVGSGGVMLLPDQPGAIPHLMIGSGKASKLYLINRDMFTAGNNHYNQGGSSDAVLQTIGLGSGMFSTPAYLNGNVYIAASGDVGAAFALSSGTLTLSSTSSRMFPFPGATPSISANGTSNGIVWFIQRTNPVALVAYNASNLGTEFYNSTLASGNRDQLTNGVKFAVPTIANGKVYVGGYYALSVFGLLGGAVQFTNSAYAVQENAGTATITVARSGGSHGAVQVTWATVPGGTATPGVNYQPATNTLSWADGDSSPKSFSVSILDDHQATANKTINLSLSGPTGGAYLGTIATAVLTILQGPYDTWKFSHFGANANNPAVAGNLADPDGDLLPNIWEYALASDPNASDATNGIASLIITNHFELRFHRNLSATDLTIELQRTAQMMGPWTDKLTFTSPVGWATNSPGMTVSESAPMGSPPNQYSPVTISEISGVKTSTPAFFRVLLKQ